MPFAHAFQTSFWSPTASIDLYPNFKYGFDTLHKRLARSITENEIISQYIQQRIESERAYGQSLSKLTIIPLEDDLTGLSRCFGVVCAESETSAKEHVARAENVNTTALDPLQRFSARYSRIIATTKQAIEQQMDQFEMLVKQVEQAKLNYQTRCKAILTLQPTYRPTVIRLGTRVFHERFEIEDWLKSLNETLDRKMIIDWLESENQSVSVMHDLIGLNFIRQVDEDLFEKVKTKKGFFTWNSRQEVYVKEMLQADKVYRDLVIKIDKMRTEIEEALFMHFEEMENLELERIQTLKQVFISLAASLSNTIPRFKETVDNMMLYQETLKPDKDVQMIVEQYRTGQFIPRPILYENYFYGTSRHQLFGVSLEDLSRNEASLIPRFISSGISFIESDISKLENEEKKHIWVTSLPLDKVHSVREEINQHYPLITIERYDILMIASIIKLYLMELPDCLFTFELYEPFKLLYSNQNQDKESRLISISKLLTTLPSANYHVSKSLFSHFHELIHDTTLIKSLAKTLSYILLRPQIETKISRYERHSQKLIEDLIEHYPLIFTKESIKAQEGNSTRISSILSTKSRRLIPSSSTLFKDPDQFPVNSNFNSTKELRNIDSFFLDE